MMSPTSTLSKLRTRLSGPAGRAVQVTVPFS
uniref:Uncharacterized protein n=1 Tax=Anguilla anguilla TaxID=7936 RepID=A0A0E9VKM8_ANGAN